MAGEGSKVTQFKKGQSGNPKGRPKTREDLKKIKLMTADEASRLIQKIVDMDADKLADMMADPKTPALEIMVAKVVLKAIQEGDTSRINFIFDRTVGKVIDKREVEVRPVTYEATVREDGTLIQQVAAEEAAGETIDGEIKKPEAEPSE